jgi:hypothetical protein
MGFFADRAFGIVAQEIKELLATGEISLVKGRRGGQ